MKYGCNPLFTGTNNIFIADIHCEGDKLVHLLELLKNEVDLYQYRIVFLGDLLGKGPQVINTLNTIVDLLDNLHQVFIVKGNWDTLFHDIRYWGKTFPDTTIKEFVKNNKIAKFLLNIGEEKTMKEINTLFENNNYWKIEDAMIDYFETPNIIATHAPIDTTLVDTYLDEENPEAFLENLINADFITKHFVTTETKIEGINKLFICGHQPCFPINPTFKEKAKRREKPTKIDNRIMLDCGGAGTNNGIPIFAYIEDKDLFVG